MSSKKFNKLFGIEENSIKEKNRFVSRINETIFKTIKQHPYPDNYERLFKDICYQYGISGSDLISQFNRRNYDPYITHIPSLRKITNDDFLETLKILVLLYNSVSQQNIKRINGSIKLALSMTTLDLGIRWKDGLFYPSGAKELDERLINDNLEWLQSFPNVKNFFTTSLQHFKKSIKNFSSRKDAITNAYSSIESFAKKVLNNNKNFEKNSDDLVKFLSLPSEYKNIIYYYKQIAHKYSSRHAGSNSPHKEFSHEETEAFIYMTGLLMRLIQQKI